MYWHYCTETQAQTRAPAGTIMASETSANYDVWSNRSLNVDDITTQNTSVTLTSISTIIDETAAATAGNVCILMMCNKTRTPDTLSVGRTTNHEAWSDRDVDTQKTSASITVTMNDEVAAAATDSACKLVMCSNETRCVTQRSWFFYVSIFL